MSTAPDLAAQPVVAPSERFLIGVLTMTLIVCFGCQVQPFAVLHLPMTEDLGVSRAAVAAGASVSTLAGAFAALPVGRLIERYGGRSTLATGSLLGVAALIGWSQAQNLVQLYLALAVSGLAVAMTTYEAAFSVLVVAIESERRDGAIARIAMITGFSTSLFNPFVGWLQALLGWRDTLLVLAAILFVVSLPAHLFLVPDRAAHLRHLSARSGLRFGEALTSPRFWLLSAAFVGQAGSAAAFSVLMVTYFRDVGFSLAVASTLPVTLGVTMLLARLLVGPAFRVAGKIPVTAAAFGLQGLGLLLLPLAHHSLPLTILCIAGEGLGQGVSIVARPALAADVFGILRFASITAAMFVPVALARAGGPIAAGLVGSQHFLQLAGMLAVVGALSLVPLIYRKGTTA